MWQFLLGSTWFMAPLYLLAIVYLEGAVYLVRRQWGLLALWACGAIISLLILEYLSSGPSYIRETRPLASLSVMLWIVGVPVAVLTGASFLLVRVRGLAIRQVLVLVTAIVVVFSWPGFALYSVCASGLDCL